MVRASRAFWDASGFEAQAAGVAEEVVRALAGSPPRSTGEPQVLAAEQITVEAIEAALMGSGGKKDEL